MKALYRKAGARMAMSDLEEAKEIYEKILEIDPENKVLVIVAVSITIFNIS